MGFGTENLERIRHCGHPVNAAVGGWVDPRMETVGDGDIGMAGCSHGHDLSVYCGLG